jgi:hypothetical protein
MSEQASDIDAGQPDAGAPERGPEVIKRFVKTLPGKPGVYRMYDAKG